MKEFSILNGYAVKDQVARDEILRMCETYPNPQMYGAIGDGVHDDTEAIQAALDSGKDIYFPDGKYLVTGEGLKMTKEQQSLVFSGGAWIEAKNLTANGAVLLVDGRYNKLKQVKIRMEDPGQTVNGIQLGKLKEDEVEPTQSKSTINASSTTKTLQKHFVYTWSTIASFTKADVKLQVNDPVTAETIPLTPANWKNMMPNMTLSIEPAEGGTFSFDGGATTFSGLNTLTYQDFEAYEQDKQLVLRIIGKTIPFTVWIDEVKGDENFATNLNEVTVTGTGLAALQVYGLEARVSGGKFRGTKYGVNVEAADFYADNVYCEQCTADGFRARNGSIEGHHIHAYANGNKGFNLANINFSNFYGIYADKNYSDGVYIADVSGELNIFGGWGFYSGYERKDRAVFDWNFSNVRDLNLYGCRSNRGNDSKAGSYNVNATSRVYFHGCMATLEPSIKDGGIARFTDCQNVLRTYNSASQSYSSAKVTLPPKGESLPMPKTAKIYTDNMWVTDNDVNMYEITVQYRGSTAGNSGFVKYMDVFGPNYNPVFTAMTEENPDLTITRLAGTMEVGGAVKMGYMITNKNVDEEIDVIVTATKVSAMH